MKLKAGDKVRFLNETGGGIVLRIINQKMVEIKDENDFILPVSVSELVRIPGKDEKEDHKTNKKDEQPYVKDNSYNYAERDQWDYLEEKKHTEKEKNEYNLPVKDQILLAFVPDNQENTIVSDLNVFLINDSSFNILFNISQDSEDGYISLEHGEIESGVKMYISTLKREELNKTNFLNVQAISYKKNLCSYQETIDYTFKFKNIRFFKPSTFSENEYFDQTALLVTLSGSEPAENGDKIIAKKVIADMDKLKNLAAKFKQVTPVEMIEVDLHINTLVENCTGMSNGEMLNIQLSHFRKNMEYAILNKLKKIVFIHGIGNGTLKHEVRKILKEEYSNYNFQDASFKEYGYGATLVLL